MRLQRFWRVDDSVLKCLQGSGTGEINYAVRIAVNSLAF